MFPGATFNDVTDLCSRDAVPLGQQRRGATWAIGHSGPDLKDVLLRESRWSAVSDGASANGDYTPAPLPISHVAHVLALSSRKNVAGVAA